MVTSSPDDTMKFGLTQVSTQLLQHLEQTKASADQGGRVTQSAAQVLKELNYTIPTIDSASDIQSSSKYYDSMKEADDDEKPKVEIDDKGLQILQGTSHHNKKKLEADSHRKIIAHILARDLDPSGHLIDMVKIRHELKPYGLNQNEWRCFVIHHKNIDRKNVTLAQISRPLVMELEPKITKLELIRDREQNP